MATFILVHGSFAGAYCWREVISQLMRRHHRVIALDLPAHGDDLTPIENVTLQTYIDTVSRAVHAQRETPILVGHSMSGHIAGAAELDPSSVAAVVLVAGLLPPNGRTMMQSVEQFDPAYLAQAIWADDRRSARISAEGTRQFICPLAPEGVADEVVRRMRPEPLGPYDEPVVTTATRFGQTARYYVETLQDRVVPLSMQRGIQAQVGFNRVFSLDADHCPFFCVPEKLATCLDAVAAEL